MKRLDQQTLTRICPPSPYESQRRDVDLPWSDIIWAIAPHLGVLAFVAACGVMLWWSCT
jgi:hypothetical protein